jgi:hypothetical protein
MTEITIRPLTPADAAAFKALRLQGLQEIPSAFGSSYEEECDTLVEELARRFAPQAGRARFGAFDGEHLVGIAGIGQEEKAQAGASREFVGHVCRTGISRARCGTTIDTSSN